MMKITSVEVIYLTLASGLLLCLTHAEMTREGITYSKKLLKADELGINDQVLVKKSGTDEVVGQYFCDNGKCNISDCVGCFKNESGYLVLIMHNISRLDRFDASRNGEEKPFLSSFTLDEDVPSTTPAVPDEAHAPSIKTTEPPHTHKMPDEHTGDKAALVTGTIVALVTGTIVALVTGTIVVLAVLVLVDVVIARRAGRDPKTARVFTSLRRKLCDPEPNQQEQNAVEMKDFIPKPGMPKRGGSSDCCDYGKEYTLPSDSTLTADSETD